MILDYNGIKISVESETQGTDLHITTIVNERTIHQIYNLQEQAIRQALIKLGWTPPKEDI